MAATKKKVKEKGPRCGKGVFCAGMERCLGDVHAKGLSVLSLFDLKKGTQHVAGVRYKTTPRDPGLMLNSCPWCLTNYRTLFKMSAVVKSRDSFGEVG